MQPLLLDIAYFIQNDSVWTFAYESLVHRYHFLFKCSFKPSDLKPTVLSGLSNAFR